MEDLGFYSPEEEQRKALNNYTKERDKLSKTLVQPMNKQSRKERLVEGSIGGVILGVLFGFIVGQTNGRVPVRDASGRVVEYKNDTKKTIDAMLKTLAVAVLLMLGTTGVTIIADNKRNKNLATKLATDTMKQYFDLPLKNYRTENTTPVRDVRVAALVINNMPRPELDRLCALVQNGLACDEHGHYSIQNDAIATASQIISNFINYNPELGYNILRIMRGEEPTTYVLRNTQKTR